MEVNRYRTRGEAEDDRDLVMPYRIIDDQLYDEVDTKQRQQNREKYLVKRSIRHHRHATTKWGAALESFRPMWFAICISSSGIGLVLNGPFVYRAHWQITIATIMYIVSLITFFIFLGLQITRWVVFPHVAVRRAMSDPDELGAYAIPPIALMTLASLTIMQVSTSWGGYAFMMLGYVLWWIGVVWVFITAVVVLCTLIYTGSQSGRNMSPVLFMAPVGLATAGAEAGFITIFGNGEGQMSPRLAVPMIVVGYFALGIAFFMALLLYTIYFHRLLSAGWSAPAKRAGLFILIGPAGQLSTALQLLGESANWFTNLADYKPPAAFQPPTRGTFFTAGTARGIDGAGILLALLLLGFDYLMFCIATVGVVDIFIRRQASYSLTWWSIVFPTVTLTTAWLELSFSMDSPAFRVLTCIMTVFLTIVYCVNLCFTLRGIFNGSLIFAQTELQMEDGVMKKVNEGKDKEEAV